MIFKIHLYFKDGQTFDFIDTLYKANTIIKLVGYDLLSYMLAIPFEKKYEKKLSKSTGKIP